MPETFLSDAWFAEVDKLRDQMPAPSPAVADMVMNIVVTGGPDGDREIRMEKGQFEQGLVDGAPTKLTVPYEVAKAIFIDGNSQAGMQAFMAGQIKVEGDMSKLMAMQGSAPTPEQQEFTKKLQAITA